MERKAQFMEQTSVVVFTGGAATRMRPLSLGKDKCMIPFMGRPLLSHLVVSLAGQGLRDLHFTSAGKIGEIEAYYGDGSSVDARIRYSAVERWLGTAGTIADLVRNQRDISDPFFVIYGDSLLDVDYKAMLEFHHRNSSTCTILFHRPQLDQFKYEYHDSLFENLGPRTNYGVMNLTRHRRITLLEEKPLLGEISSRFEDPVANAAVYVLSKGTMQQVPQNQLVDFPRHLFPHLITHGSPVFGFDIKGGYRFDIGTLENYYSVQFEILRGNISFRHYYHQAEQGLWVGLDSKIESLECIQKPVMLGDNSTIGRNTRVCSSIIGNGVSVDADCIIENSIILDHAVIGKGTRVKNSIVGEESQISGSVPLPANSVLGDYCLIGYFACTEFQGPEAGS
jgi:mannose-1-phosphate guanylyltransferase / phosphomannomutase